MEKKKGLTREFSAGGVVFRKTQKTTSILLIKPAGTDRWQLPKGGLKEKESSGEAALREVLEETGVHAEILDRIGTIQYFYNQAGERIFKTVVFFLMKYKAGKASLGNHNKVEVDDVRWSDEGKAKELISFKDEKDILEKGLRTAKSLLF